jgi:hypothetical protein
LFRLIAWLKSLTRHSWLTVCSIQTGVIQTSCSVYNVHAKQKTWTRSDEGRHWIWVNFSKPNPSNSVIKISPSSVSQNGTFDPE